MGELYFGITLGWWTVIGTIGTIIGIIIAIYIGLKQIKIGSYQAKIGEIQTILSNMQILRSNVNMHHTLITTNFNLISNKNTKEEIADIHKEMMSSQKVVEYTLKRIEEETIKVKEKQDALDNIKIDSHNPF